MDLGLFVVPFRRLETDLRAGFEHDMQVVQWAEEYGFSEVWFAEHFTIGYELGPSPEACIAVASQQTKKIRLGVAANLLPYHNPIALAHRAMFLDHITGGRYMCGVAAGAFPTDKQLFATDDNVAMLNEGIDIIRSIWTANGRAFKFEGKYWTVDYPKHDEFWGGPNLKPYQDPHPPIAMMGASPNSESMKRAGREGFIPISESLHASFQADHWNTYSAAAEAAGRVPDRMSWRTLQYTLVADTDEEAKRLAHTTGFWDACANWVLPLLKELGFDQALAPDVPSSEITADYLIDNLWLVGSPDTVASRIESLYEETGGFGMVVMYNYDDVANPEPIRRSLELMAKEVAPRLEHLGAKATQA